VRFKPAQTREVALIPFGGNGEVHGCCGASGWWAIAGGRLLSIYKKHWPLMRAIASLLATDATTKSVRRLNRFSP
jgi:hypothetical protein